MNASKIILTVLLLCFASCTVDAQYVSSLKLKNDILLLKDSTQRLSEKSPLLAGTLSFIVPGLALGQFYNGHILKGILHVAISGLAFAMFIKNFGPGGSRGYESIAIAGFVLYLANWIYSTFEAIAAAEKINKQVKLQKYRSDLIDRSKFGFTVNKNKQLNLRLALEL